MSTDVAHTEAGLSRLLDRRLGWKLTAGSVERLTGGAVQQTWAFAATSGSDVRPLIFRQLSAHGLSAGEGIGPESEAALIGVAAAHGVPVPAIHYVLVTDDDLGRGFLCDRIDGETLGGRIVRDPAYAEIRPKLAGQCGEILARLHSVPVATLPPITAKPVAAQLDELRHSYEASCLPNPTFEVAFRWLRDNQPASAPTPCFVHGDFRNGNLIVGSEGIRAVLDWELAHLGDPAEDLGWMTVNSWRFGARDLPVGGFGTVEQMLTGYEKAGGRPIDPRQVTYWRAFGSLKWGVIAQGMARVSPGEAPLSVERALIGRRSSETELDLLDALAAGDAA